MGKEIKLYTNKECIYCTKLKTGLKKSNIDYIDIDVDNPDNCNEIENVYSLAGESIIPIITIKPHLLVPKKSFNTIDEALELIKFLMK